MGQLSAQIQIVSYKQLGALQPINYFIKVSNPVYIQQITCDPDVDACFMYYAATNRPGAQLQLATDARYGGSQDQLLRIVDDPAIDYGKASIYEHQIFVEDNTGHLHQVREPPLTLPSLPPVAILMDGGTASSGEATVISFLGRPHTRTFGAHTTGLTTANSGFPLPDGAMLFLSTSVEEDRIHHMYLDGIEPDVAIPQPSAQPAEADDIALQTAEQWLLSQHTN